MPATLNRQFADIVIEMTFFGWSEKQTASRSKKELRKLERSAVIDSSERLIPAELAHRELGLEPSTAI